MRPPFSESEPTTRGVSMAMRGVRARPSTPHPSPDGGVRLHRCSGGTTCGYLANMLRHKEINHDEIPTSTVLRGAGRAHGDLLG